MNKVCSPKESYVTIYHGESTEPTITSLKMWYESVKHVFETGPTLLLLDDYNLHHKFKGKINSNTLSIKLFPPGCSCKLQPLNVSIRRQFMVRQQRLALQLPSH